MKLLRKELGAVKFTVKYYTHRRKETAMRESQGMKNQEPKVTEQSKKAYKTSMIKLFK